MIHTHTTAIVSYRGYHGCESRCQLEVHPHEDFTLVVATELHDNQGRQACHSTSGGGAEVSPKEANGPVQESSAVPARGNPAVGNGASGPTS